MEVSSKRTSGQRLFPGMSSGWPRAGMLANIFRDSLENTRQRRECHRDQDPSCKLMDAGIGQQWN